MKTTRELLKNRIRQSRYAAKVFALLAVFIGLAFDLTACGHTHDDNVFSTKPLPEVELPFKPDQKLIPSAALHPSETQPSYYDVYQLKSAEFGADRGRREISARVQIESTGGSEKIELLGKIRDDGSASLLDIQPNEQGQYRATAEAFCVDQDKCLNIILNVLIKVGSHTLRKQFVSSKLAPPLPTNQAQPTQPATPKAPLAPVAPVAPLAPTGPLTPAVPSAPARPSAPETVPPVVPPGSLHSLPPPAVYAPQVPAPEQADQPPSAEVSAAPPSSGTPEQMETELEGNPNDPNDEMLGTNLDDEYVGAQPSDEIINKLWDRPEHPSAGSALPHVPGSGTGSGSAENSDKDKSIDAKGNGPQITLPAPVGSKMVPPSELLPVPPVPPNPPTPTAPAPSQTAPPARPETPTIKSGRRANNSALPIPVPPIPPPAPEQSAALTPQVAQAEDVAPAKAGSAMEMKLAPFLNLSEGGKATGSYTDGKILIASPLGFTQAHNLQATDLSRNTHWGSGLLVSFIEAAANKMTKWYPELVVAIGDIAFQHGGRIGQHSSHQNGLDIDIPYLGKQSFVSIVSHGQVEAGFDYAQTWQFFRLVESQKIVDKGVSTTVLNRIFVTKEVKNGFCKWAKENNVLANPRDADIMRRLRPTPLHDNHFHLRLKCSPYYQSCRKQVEPPTGTGCN